MIAHAPAKLNLALAVGVPRPDGYHELVTIFQTISLADELSLAESEALTLEVEGDAPSGPENLVLKAARRLGEAAGVNRGAALRLTKRIPTGAGLGGGSSDAATALVALDRLWGLRACREDLVAIAADLGSDVAFFLLGGTVLGLGRGERLFALSDLPARHVVLALPGFAVSTAAAYRLYDKRGGGGVLGSSERWRLPLLWDWAEGCFEGLGNDLEAAVFALHPELAGMKAALRGAGAEHALLTGSGSTVYGLFRDSSAAAAAVPALGGAGGEALLTTTLGREGFRALQLGDR